MVTKLENLPNEIIINIVEYVSSPADVYRAFIGLNQRFDIILRQVRLSIDIFWEDEQYLTLSRYFATHCDRLRVFNVCPSITIVRFSRLRSLTITQPTDAQINSIRSTTLPMLEYLATPADLITFDYLFGNDQQRWPFLRYCNFYFSPIPKPKITWQPNSNLCILSGITCLRNTLSQLLTLVPCLEHLRVDMIPNDHSNWIEPVNIRNLVSLRIGFSLLDYDDLCVLIGPSLRHLYLEVYDKFIQINFSYLGALLVLIPQNLNQFNIDYRGATIDIKAIRSAHPLFRNTQQVHSFSNDTVKLVCKNMDQV